MRYSVALMLFILSLTLQAQTWEQVKSSKIYLYGEGYGTSVADADKQALSDLISKIVVNVSSVTNQKEEETMKNGKLTSNSDFASSVQTYSQATLTNTERIIITNEPDAHVGRWIKRSEIEKIFESRKNKINDLIEAAQRGIQSKKIDDALRSYYWALTLLKSLQHPNDMFYTDENGKKTMMTVWLPEQINQVLGNLKAVVNKKNGNEIELHFFYNNTPVSSVDYTYFDGRDWSSIYSAKDGVGVLELAAGNTSDHFQLKYEFEYRGQAHIDKEIESVLNTVKSTPMRNAYTNVKLKNVSNTSRKDFVPSSNAVATLTKPIEGDADYKTAILKVMDAVTKKNYNAVSDLFTEDGKEVYQKLICYGAARVVGTPNLQFYQNGENVTGRGLQMSFSFKNGLKKSFIEDLSFTFDKDKRIKNISFGLGQSAEKDILGKGVWSETARKAIMDFLENYQTAYALKRLDYIKTIFDDDAVIITGRVSKKSIIHKNREGYATIDNNEIIKYNRMSKNEYIKNLAYCFASNEFVNIHFANNDVLKMAKGGEMYAIQIAQDYYSTNYGDKGYLFLIVDINNPEQPLIKVRTWQPEKDPNFGLYGPGDF